MGTKASAIRGPLSQSVQQSTKEDEKARAIAARLKKIHGMSDAEICRMLNRNPEQLGDALKRTTAQSAKAPKPHLAKSKGAQIKRAIKAAEKLFSLDADARTNPRRRADTEVARKALTLALKFYRASHEDLTEIFKMALDYVGPFLTEASRDLRNTTGEAVQKATRELCEELGILYGELEAKFSRR